MGNTATLNEKLSSRFSFKLRRLKYECNVAKCIVPDWLEIAPLFQPI